MKIHLETGENPSSTTSYMAFYLTTSMIELVFKGVLPDIIMTFCLKLYIEDYSMGFCNGACLKRKLEIH